MSHLSPPNAQPATGRRRFVAVALAAVLGAGLATPALAASRRRVRMPDGSVRTMTEREYRRWQRSAKSRDWRGQEGTGQPDGWRDGESRNSGELGDAPRRRSNPGWRPRDGRDIRYPADGG